MSDTIFPKLIILIIAFTCVGVFIATAIASVLDLFNCLKLAPDIRKKLHAILLVEIVGISVGTFSGFLNPQTIVHKVESDKSQLKKETADLTRAVISRAGGAVVDFPWVDTDSVPSKTVAAAPYLHDVEISISEMNPQTSEIVLINNRALYKGAAVRPTTSQNFLTQINTNNIPASFTLKFSQPVKSVRFTRPALYPATESGITHPAWSAHALNAGGKILSSQSEDITRSFKDVPSETYTLKAPGFEDIVAVRFESDPRLNGVPFAAFSALLIERLTLMWE